MTVRADIKKLITTDRFPAPTKPFHSAEFPARPITFFFTSGAVDYLPPESKNDRRFMVVEATKPSRCVRTGCPIQVDGPYYARNHHHRARAVASALLMALVATALRGG